MRLSSSQAVAANADIPFDTFDFDPSSMVTTGSSAHFTILQTGVYLVMASMATATTGVNCAVNIVWNGSQVGAGVQPGSNTTGAEVSVATDLLAFHAGDTVAFQPNAAITVIGGALTATAAAKAAIIFMAPA